jgi:hypothetical protein
MRVFIRLAAPTMSIFQPTYAYLTRYACQEAILSLQRFASFLLLLPRGASVFTIIQLRFSSRLQGIVRVLGSDSISKGLANPRRNGRSSWQIPESQSIFHCPLGRQKGSGSLCNPGCFGRNHNHETFRLSFP